MVGAKKGKHGDMSSLSPEFENNPYEALDDLLFDSELEFIVSIEDNYLKQAMAKFLTDNNLRQKNKNFEDYEYMFISLDLGTFNFIEKPNYQDKRVYELPYDWNELMTELKDYIAENPFEKYEIADKNPESWSIPREDTPGTDYTKNDGESFLERAKKRLGMNSDASKQEKIDAMKDSIKEMASGLGMKDVKFDDDGITLVPESNDEVEIKNYNSTDEIKEVLHKVEDNENFSVWSSEANDDFPFVKKDDSGRHNNGGFDTYSEQGSDNNPYTMASMYFEDGELTAYVEIKKPFTRYEDDEYGATQYIEFENGDVYKVMFNTPMEQQAYDKIEDGLEDMSGKAIYDSFESVNKIVDELIV